MPGQNLGSKIGSAFIEVGASFVGFGSGLASDVSNSLLAQGFVVGQALESFGQAVFSRFSLPLLAATAANITQFQALDREIRTTLTLFGTAPSLVQDTFGEMSSGIRRVSEDVGGLERDIADGLYQAISAGVPRGGVFDFLETAQMAAMADRTADLTTAVDGLTTVVNAFGLESTDAERAADVMFQTVALGKTTFGELSQDIGRVAPLAANAGVAFEELFAIVGALTLQGLSTSEAISFLRASITGLLRPTEELNAVFAEFGTAERAIPVIGLQQAFQLVFDSVGGSTSKMQELIGTSEGVSAALGIVGDNADTYARIMTGVENSTGAASRAFEIMDQSVGRSFGRLTEAFDRLGNTFGAMASEFAGPALDVATDLINNLVGVFEGAQPIVRGLGSAFGELMEIFQLPVIKEVTTLFAAMAITIGGLIGSVGLLALTFGKLITALLSTKLAIRVVALLAPILSNLRNVALASSIATRRLASALTDNLAHGGGLAAAALRGLSNIMRTLALSPVGATLAITGIVLALGALVAAFGAAINAQKEYVESQDTLGKGVDALIESLGLIDLGIGHVGESTEEATTTAGEFEQANRDLINRLKETRDVMGEIAALDLAEGLVAELVLRGNAPEEVLKQIQLLEQLSGVEVDIDLSDLEDSSFLSRQLAESVLVLGDSLEAAGFSHGEISAQAQATAKGFVDLFKATQASGDIDLFSDALTRVQEGLNPDALETFAIFLKKGFESGLDVDLGFDFTPEGILGEGELLSRLEREGVSLDLSGIVEPIDVEALGLTPENLFEGALPEGTPLDSLLDEETLQRWEEARKVAEEFGITASQAFSLTPEQTQGLADATSGVAELFAAAREQVNGAMADIRASVEAQQPLLDVYGGKIDQSFAKWRAGQNQFQEDVRAVTTLRDHLIEADLPDALISAFDRQPLSKQVWLAGLGEKQLEEALAELEESFVVAQEAGQERVLQSFDTIFETANQSIAEGYLSLATEAAMHGPIVADAFNKEFETASANWVITANNVVADLKRALGVFIPGPTIGAPQFQGGASIQSNLPPQAGNGDTNINIISPSTSDLVGDASKAAVIIGTRNIPN